jgi:hypothetical protein
MEQRGRGENDRVELDFLATLMVTTGRRFSFGRQGTARRAELLAKGGK